MDLSQSPPHDVPSDSNLSSHPCPDGRTAKGGGGGEGVAIVGTATAAAAASPYKQVASPYSNKASLKKDRDHFRSASQPTPYAVSARSGGDGSTKKGLNEDGGFQEKGTGAADGEVKEHKRPTALSAEVQVWYEQSEGIEALGRRSERVGIIAAFLSMPNFCNAQALRQLLLSPWCGITHHAVPVLATDVFCVEFSIVVRQVHCYVKGNSLRRIFNSRKTHT